LRAQPLSQVDGGTEPDPTDHRLLPDLPGRTGYWQVPDANSPERRIFHIFHGVTTDKRQKRNLDS
jgi:hypothetical protein